MHKEATKPRQESEEAGDDQHPGGETQGTRKYRSMEVDTRPNYSLVDYTLSICLRKFFYEPIPVLATLPLVRVKGGGELNQNRLCFEYRYPTRHEGEVQGILCSN